MSLKKIKDMTIMGEVKGLVRDLVTLDKSVTQLEMENKKKKRRPHSSRDSTPSSSGADSDTERGLLPPTSTSTTSSADPTTSGGESAVGSRGRRGGGGSGGGVRVRGGGGGGGGTDTGKSTGTSASSERSRGATKFDTLEEEAPYSDDPYERRLKALQMAEQGHLQHNPDIDEFVQNLRQQLIIREDQLRNTERLLISKQKEIAQATVSLEEYRHNVVSTSEQLKHVTAQMEQLKQDKYELQHRVEELMSELSQMDGKVTTLNADLGRANRKITVLQSQLQLEKSASESAQMEAERNQREVENLRTQVITLEGQLKECRLTSAVSSGGGLMGYSSGGGNIQYREDAELRDMVHRLQTQLRDTQESYKQLLQARRQEVVASGDQYITLHDSSQSGGSAVSGARSTEDRRLLSGNPYSIHALLRVIFNNPSNMIVITLVGILVFVLYYFVATANTSQPVRICKPCTCPSTAMAVPTSLPSPSATGM